MASLLVSLALLSLILFFSLSAASRHHQKTSSGCLSAKEIIHEACKASRDPPTCEAALAQSDHVPYDATIMQVIQTALWLSSQNLNKAQGMVQEILDASTRNVNRSIAAKSCLEVLHYSDYRINMTNVALASGKIKDARAWMSAGLAYQYNCWGGLMNVNQTSQVNQTMAFLYSLAGLSSNALGMIVNYDNFGKKTKFWAMPKTERDGFWEGGSGDFGFVGGVPSDLKADVTVCKDGGCSYETVQDAVNAAPDYLREGKRFVIGIQTGVYNETVRVPFEKKNVVFLGDGMGKTVITGSLNVGLEGVSTYNSATVGVVGDGFMASGLTIENKAGPNAHQAVAFRSVSDQSILENCEFLGNQDTLYAHSLRQYYKSCRIQGNVDFIFGNSASFFQDCLIFLSPRQVDPEKGETNTVTSQGRMDPAQSTGFVFQNCTINGTDAYNALYKSNPSVHKNYLGRPWKEYSRTVFIHCTLEALITSDGWLPWDGDFALKTLYYGEFENKGAGANTTKRVTWSSEIPVEHLNSYTVQNFIQGDQWIPKSS
ncbi:probable pectinesterase pectinesterase inhibitor 51 [Olea europaea subsp. europaea]|uniref:pectinesterase n=1 Tax=Olea europaea subsp. europaea TaxID=158383 RepID=A0A8S0PCL1_OLEEU|nr:probable pectinesterase pectinesterase inhibitor 51 [Olea europaea subsp. europaea]